MHKGNIPSDREPREERGDSKENALKGKDAARKIITGLTPGEKVSHSHLRGKTDPAEDASSNQRKKA